MSSSSVSSVANQRFDPKHTTINGDKSLMSSAYYPVSFSDLHPAPGVSEDIIAWYRECDEAGV
jgi:hypothetical protein